MTPAVSIAAFIALAGLGLGVQQSNAGSATSARAASPAAVLARPQAVNEAGGGTDAAAAGRAGEAPSEPPASFIAPYVIDLRPAQSVRVLTFQQWQWVRRWFTGHEWLIARIVTCESMWRDDVVGAAGERGRLQIHPIHASRFGYAPADLADPEVNGWVGARILEERPDGSAWAGAAGCSAWSIGGQG